MNREPKLMTLGEAETCDYAYILYEIDDPNVHCFLRVNTFDNYIVFDRPVKNYAHSQPHLWKDRYGMVWFPFDAPPTPHQIAACKKIMRLKGEEK